MAGIDWLQGFMKNTKSLHFASPNIQVCWRLPRSTKGTFWNSSTDINVHLNLGKLLLKGCITLT
jgi:hypothetical protein